MEQRQCALEGMVNYHHYFSFWSTKRVLVTGHCGFKGTWLIFLLRSLGAEVIGIGLDSQTSLLYNHIDPSYASNIEHIVDLCDQTKLFQVLDQCDFDIAFHLSAQPLVLDSYEDPFNTWNSNLFATLNFIEYIRLYRSSSSLFISTTDKVYSNLTHTDQHNLFSPFSESSPLAFSSDPYSVSKACVESLVASYRFSFPVLQLYTLRAGNVVGGGDRSAYRLIPDILLSLSTQKPLILRNPQATRPWQYILDTLHAYLIFSSTATLGCTAPPSVNVGPSSSNPLSVNDIISIASRRFPSLPTPVIQRTSLHESYHLQLDSSLIEATTPWPGNVYSSLESVTQTFEWEYSSHTDSVTQATLNAYSTYTTLLDTKLSLPPLR